MFCFVRHFSKLQISLEFSFRFRTRDEWQPTPVGSTLLLHWFHPAINISLNKFSMFLRVIIASLTNILSYSFLSQSLPHPQSHPRFLSAFFSTFRCCHHCKVSENNEAMMTVFLCFLFSLHAVIDRVRHMLNTTPRGINKSQHHFTTMPRLIRDSTEASKSFFLLPFNEKKKAGRWRRKASVQCRTVKNEEKLA